jgi:hypothetical protein
MNKRLVVVLLGFGLLLGGCSSAPSEVSPEQKRLDYDLCVLTQLEQAREQVKKMAEEESYTFEEKEQLFNYLDDEIAVYCKDELE